MSEILPGKLYLGGIEDSIQNEEFMKKYKIKGVLNMAKEVGCLVEDNSNIKYKHILADDSASQNMAKEFNEALDFIDSVEGPVLVHCAAGISRSPTIVIAYLMSRHNMNYYDAFKYVKARRAQVDPNFNFMCQLWSYQTTLGMLPSLIEL